MIGGTFICWYCNQGLPDKRQLEIHIKIEHGELAYGQREWFGCKPCQKIYCRQQDIKKHMRHCHGRDIEAKDYVVTNVESCSGMESNFSCEVCKQVFDDKRILECHLYIEHGNIKCYLCQICCDKLYRDANDFQKHLIEEHVDMESNLEKYVVQTLQDLLIPCKCCEQPCLLFSGFCHRHDADIRMNDCTSVNHNASHTCPTCNETFTDCILLWKHKFIEHDVWQCNVCSVSINSPRGLLSHWLANHRDRNTEDREKSNDDQCLMTGGKGEMNYKCSECGVEVSKLMLLKKHMTVVHDGKRDLSCVVCGATYARPNRLREHCLRKHTVFITTILPLEYSELDLGSINKSTAQVLTEDGQVKYKCQTCGKLFSKFPGLMRHAQSHATSITNTNLVCSFCKKKFSEKKALLKHYRNIHGVLMRSSEVAEMKMEYGITIDGATSYKCPHCTRLFQRFFSLRKHMKSHSGIRPYSCTVCNKSFVLRENLNRHSNIHTGHGYQCNICGRIMNDKTNLKVHIRNHTGEKKYMCEVCGKSFTQWSSHYYHMFTHSESRDFKCNFCEKTFKTPAGLREHKRAHALTDEKHICETCGNSFSSRKNLLSHVKIHTTERPHKCDFCGATFKRRKYLVQHHKTHIKMNA